jgi:hypothetical protein
MSKRVLVICLLTIAVHTALVVNLGCDCTQEGSIDTVLRVENTAADVVVPLALERCESNPVVVRVESDTKHDSSYMSGMYASHVDMLEQLFFEEPVVRDEEGSPIVLYFKQQKDMLLKALRDRIQNTPADNLQRLYNVALDLDEVDVEYGLDRSTAKKLLKSVERHGLKNERVASQTLGMLRGKDILGEADLSALRHILDLTKYQSEALARQTLSLIAEQKETAIAMQILQDISIDYSRHSSVVDLASKLIGGK